MKARARIIPALLVAALVGATQTSEAKDAVAVAVTIPAGQPSAIVTVNGNPVAPGNFAVGTIQLFYVFQGNELPTGLFGSFTIDLGIKTDYLSGPTTTYPINPLELEHNGGGPILTPSPSTFTVTGTSWTGSSTVTITIPEGAQVPPDGDDYVGNLKIEAGPRLGTTTNVQVHIRLVQPTECIKLYDFITDADYTAAVTSTEVNVNAKKNSINSTQPYGQLSDNVLVVNTCSAAQPFDLGVTLDPFFRTNPYDNPGNAVFTYFISGQEDDTINIAALGGGTPRGQQLCLQNVTIDGGDSFLATVKMAINKSLSASSLTGDTFSFSARLYAAGSACAGDLGVSVLPANPVTTSVTYTVK